MDKRYDKLRKDRRFVIVPVDIMIFGRMMIDETQRFAFEGLPKDAIFVAAEKDVPSQTFSFIYFHESFDKVPEGQMGNIFNITVKTSKDVLK